MLKQIVELWIKQRRLKKINKEVEIYFTGCFLPKTTGDNYLVLESEDTVLLPITEDTTPIQHVQAN